MPVRSLHSSVLKWPDRRTVEEAAAAWAARERLRHQGLVRLGWFGSYARGVAGVGSDLDLVAVVESLPVPAEILVYTRDEWQRMNREGGRFARTLEREARWFVEPEPAG